ncbi:MAG TPA: hypothetical protein VN926_06705 [Bradyrhizobium sp.]|jgi:hypothetical protein|nr:hypothetical protein [Bradyrhizobium sp.]
MALHRDIYWVGKQWAVTGFGVQACNQKQRGRFDIEGARLWEDGVLERLRAEAWFNSADFDKALEVARKYYPEPPRNAAPPKPPVAAAKEVSPKEIPRPAPPTEARKPAAQKFVMRIDGWPAKFVKPWHVRIRR